MASASNLATISSQTNKPTLTTQSNSMKTRSKQALIASTILLAFAFNAMCQSFSVSVSATAEDVKQTCNVTYIASPSGGCPPYTYSWSSSTGNCCPETSNSVTATAAILGPGTMTVTVTDSLGATATGSKNYHVRKEVETTGPTSGGTSEYGAGNFVSPSLTCPVDSNGCTLTLTATQTISASIGISVSAGVDAGVVKTQVQGTTTTTISSAQGYSMAVQLSPGQTKAMYARPRIVKRSGTWTKYGCQGVENSGTWENTDSGNPAWDYTAMTPS